MGDKDIPEWRVKNPKKASVMVTKTNKLKQKNGYLLFEEEWQAWPRGPVVESVVDKMFDHRHNLKKLFGKIEELDNESVIDCADKIFKKYHKTEPYILSQKAQNKPWKDARKPLKSEKETAGIGLDNLIKFTNGKHYPITA